MSRFSASNNLGQAIGQLGSALMGSQARQAEAQFGQQQMNAQLQGQQLQNQAAQQTAADQALITPEALGQLFPNTDMGGSPIASALMRQGNLQLGQMQDFALRRQGVGQLQQDPRYAQQLIEASSGRGVDVGLSQARQAQARGAAGASNALATQRQALLPSQISLNQARAGAAGSPMVNIKQGAGETEQAKMLGKNLAEIQIGANQAALRASEANAKLGQLEVALTQAGPTGLGATSVQFLKKLGQTFGLDVNPEQVGAAEAATALGNQLAASLRVPGTGAQSDFEVKLLMSQIPSLSTTPEGRQQLIANLRQINDRAIQQADFIRQEASGSPEGILTPEFHSRFSQFVGQQGANAPQATQQANQPGPVEGVLQQFGVGMPQMGGGSGPQPPQNPSITPQSGPISAQMAPQGAPLAPQTGADPFQQAFGQPFNPGAVVMQAHPQWGDINMADLQTTMQANGMTLEQVLQALQGGGP